MESSKDDGCVGSLERELEEIKKTISISNFKAIENKTTVTVTCGAFLTLVCC